MFSDELGAALDAAMEEARRRQHPYVPIELALGSMLQDERIKEILCDNGVDIRALALSLEGRLSSYAQASADPDTVYQACSALPDNEWQQILLNSVRWPFYKGVKLPDLPPQELQEKTTGTSGKNVLREPYRLYKSIKSQLVQYRLPLSANNKVLDFGCGWGRYSRYFLKDVDSRNLYGVDVSPQFIDVCKQTFPYGNFATIDLTPPTQIGNGEFDLIFASTLFTRWASSLADQWVAELSRLLAPGGLLIMVTRGRRFIQRCKDIRESGNHEHQWQINLANSFVDTDACLEAYDRGEYLFAPTEGDEPQSTADYGYALIPRKYIEQVWGQHLEFRSFIDDRNTQPLVLVVMQKKHRIVPLF